MKLFLRMKHWQLFLLLYGLPFILDMIAIVLMIPRMVADISQQKPPIDIFPQFFSFIVIIVLINVIFHFLWYWTVGTNLCAKLPAAAPMKLGRFKALLLFQLIYIFFFLGLMAFMMNGFISAFDSQFHGAQPDAVQLSNPFTLFPPIFLLVIPLHFFAAFCMFYLFYFISKTFKAVELQRPVEFGDYVAEFFLLWFFFIGVWIIQPKINKLFAENPELPQT